VLDPYSATVFSSSPETFARVEQLVASGLSIDAAIEAVAYSGRGVDHAIAAE
jgi:conjugal transfer ATP-binding protein TraC